MAYLRDRSLAEMPNPAACDTQTPFAVIRDFCFDKQAVPATERAAIGRLAEQIRARRIGLARLVGHTDLVGTDAYNINLGLQRARAVEAELRAALRGTPIDIRIESLGERCTAVAGTTEAA